jgi:predicted nucleic acid-binding protein
MRYVESSALVAAFLEADAPARKALRAPGRRVSSMLTLAEAHRAVRRAQGMGRLTAADQRRVARGLSTFARRCAWVTVSDDILTRAGGPFPVEPLRTLDAIHLATLESLGEPPQLVSVITRDVRIADNARAMGYTVAPS